VLSTSETLVSWSALSRRRSLRATQRTKFKGHILAAMISSAGSEFRKRGNAIGTAVNLAFQTNRTHPQYLASSSEAAEPGSFIGNALKQADRLSSLCSLYGVYNFVQ
jgi:hypothetical protein